MSPRPSGGPPELPGLTFIKEIGVGGYADVHLYEQAMPRMRVAVKVLFAEGLSEEVRRRFTAEANTMAELADHPNIVQVFRAGVTEDGRPYLVMKYYPQRNLALRSKLERLSVPEVLAIGVRIACAVETAHRAGILHRDIKPANILTSQYGEPGLTDFGIATTKGDEMTGDAPGMSVPWAPPEVLFATAPADERSDVYSLGATLWHLLVGHSPFEVPGGDNSSLAMMRRVREQPPPRTGREDVPTSLERVLAQAMAKDQAARPSSALSLARSLQAVEIEQRWNPTPLVLLDTAEAARAVDPTEPDPGEERTRLRGPTVVHAQPSAPGPAAPAPHPEETEGATVSLPRWRGAPPSSPQPASSPSPLIAPPSTSREQATVRRQVVPAAPTRAAEPAAPPEARPSGRRRTVVAAVAALVLVMVLATVLVVVEGHHGSSPGTNGSSPGSGASSQNALVGQGSAPGTPVVTSTRISTTEVQFTWTYTAPVAGDYFQWRVVGGDWTRTTTPSATVADAAGQQVCIQVQVGRATGTASSPISPQVCGE